MSTTLTPTIPGSDGPDEKTRLPWRSWLIGIGILAIISVSWFFQIEPGLERADQDEALEFLEVCRSVPDEMVAAIEEGVEPEEASSRISWVASESVETPGLWFVSAEHRLDRLTSGADGEIVTWAVRTLDDPGADILSAEQNAADISRWPRDRQLIDVRDKGSLDSRKCVRLLRDDVRQLWRPER